MIKLYKGDCLIESDKIKDGSVDLILTDPPYGTTACKWDSVIPFEPMWEKGFIQGIAYPVFKWSNQKRAIIIIRLVFVISRFAEERINGFDNTLFKF